MILQAKCFAWHFVFSRTIKNSCYSAGIGESHFIYSYSVSYFWILLKTFASFPLIFPYVRLLTFKGKENNLRDQTDAVRGPLTRYHTRTSKTDVSCFFDKMLYILVYYEGKNQYLIKTL